MFKIVLVICVFKYVKVLVYSGFKPFASKQIIIMTSKEGRVTCKYDEPCNYPNYDHYEFLYELVDDIVNKAGKIIAEKEIILMEKNDFEIISDLTEECNYLAMDNINNYLETIEENNMTNKTYSIDNGEDLIQVINEEDVNDGLVADNHLTEVVSNDGDLTQYNVFTKSDYRLVNIISIDVMVGRRLPPSASGRLFFGVP